MNIQYALVEFVKKPIIFVVQMLLHATTDISCDDRDEEDTRSIACIQFPKDSKVTFKKEIAPLYFHQHFLNLKYAFRCISLTSTE